MLSKIISYFINNIQTQFPSAHRWRASDYYWIAVLPPATKGKLGRIVVHKILTEFYGNIVARVGRDLEITGQKKTYILSVKCSLLWESGGYAFEQIKKGYDGYCFLGISPDKTIHLWIVPSIEYKNFDSQHNKDSRWVHIDPSTKSCWDKYGGKLSTLTPKSFFLSP